MTVRTILKPARPPALKTRLVLEMAPEPRRRWAGKLKGERGAARNHTVYLNAEIRFLADVVEGRGCTPEFPTSAPGSSFDLDGARTGRELEFALWFAAETVRTSPFDCAGKVDAKLRNIRGEWSFACFRPDTCGCSGGGGGFHFWRLD